MIEHDLFNGAKTKKDMSGRWCGVCGSGETYIKKLKNGKLSPQWYGNEIDGWKCRKCRRKELWKNNKKNY